MTTFVERSHPEYRADHEPEEQDSAPLEARLQAIAIQIDAFRQLRVPIPSDRAWAREWPGLGSPRTWSRIMAGDFLNLSVAAKLPDYRGVLAALQAQSRSTAAETLYDDLGGAQEVALATLRLMHHHGKDRLIVIEGGSGSGKTSSIDLLAIGEASGSIYRLEADETWKSQRVAMRSMLLCLGVPEADVPAATGDRMEKLIHVLTRKGRIILAVDEAHHVTGGVLNLFKTLLNRTELLLILAGMKTLMQKLRAAAAEESKQLFHNRLFIRVTLGGPDQDGTRDYLSRRLSVPGAWKPAIITQIAAAAAHAGHWSYLRRIVDQLRTSGILDPTDSDLMSAASTAASEIA